MARTWLKVEGALVRHPKVRALADRYAVHPYLIVGFLIAWWDYCAEFGSGERPANCSRTVLADLAGPVIAAARETVLPEMADALRDVGLMDGHGHPKDWQEYSGALLAKRSRDAKRMATVREQSRDSRPLEQSRVEKKQPLRSRAETTETPGIERRPGDGGGMGRADFLAVIQKAATAS